MALLLESVTVLRLGGLWLAREANRLTSAMGFGTILTVWGFAIVTGSLALIIALAKGSTTALPVFLSGGIGMAGGAFFLAVLLISGDSIEARFAAQKRVFAATVSKNRAARAQRIQKRREARAQAALEAAARSAVEVLEADEEESVFVEVARSSAATRATGKCWYCKRPHGKHMQCPYCRMLIVTHH